MSLTISTKKLVGVKPPAVTYTDPRKQKLDILYSYLGRKIARREPMSHIDRHLASNLKDLKRGVFSPGKFSTILHIGTTLALPVCLVTVSFFAAKTTYNHFVNNRSKTPLLSQLNLVSQLNPANDLSGIEEVAFEPSITESQASVTAEASNSREDEQKEEQQDEQPSFTLAYKAEPVLSERVRNKTGLIKYITGVISVHHPDARDPGEIARFIVESSGKNKVDPLFISAVISVESRFFTAARSRVGALGLMQLLPNTGRDVFRQLTGRNSSPSLTDEKTNIELGITYIKQLEKRYRGNRYNALMAYNWGMRNVDNVIKNGASVPSSVQKYARTILERTMRWQSHYNSAIKNAAKAEEDEAEKTAV